MRRQFGLITVFGLVTFGAAQAQIMTLAGAGQANALGSGMEIKSGQGVLRIIALRDDILRVTMSDTGTLPEDASWAALPQARAARVQVRPANDDSSVGFDTKALRVRVDRKTLSITVEDANGEAVVSDAEQVEFKKHPWGDSFKVYKTMPENEHYFGLGDKTGPLDRRGGAYSMWNTDAYRFQEGTDPLYKDIPFFMAVQAGQSYGLFLDNTWRSSFDFGKESPDEYSFGAEGGPLDYYLFYGPEPKHVLEGYVWLTGTAPLPPLWSLGFQQSRYSYESEQQLRAVADRLRADRIPADALYMDIDFQIKNRPFALDQSKFPDFAAFVKELAQKQYHLVMITDLHIADAPDQSYAPYDSGMAGDYFVKNPAGSVYVGKVWPGDSVFPDFTTETARRWWGTLYRKFYMEGVAGFWNDMNEPSVFGTVSKTMPLDVEDRIEEPGFQKRTTTQREIHNVYGMLNSRATYEGLLALKPDQRPFVLTRATYAGGQRYAATWTGDNSSTWNHLRMSTPMLLSLGLSGFAFAGDDIGGYAGSPPMDLLTKWLEVGAFNPIYRDHTEKFTKNQEPWVGGVEQESVRRRYIEDHYHLLPYIYTLAEQASRTGIPLMRPLFLEFPNATEDRHPLDLDAPNEFLLGPDLLVAPAVYPDQPDAYAVIFPPVQWFDYWTGRRVTHNAGNAVLTTKGAKGAAAVSTGAALGVSALQTVKVNPRIDTLPVFVRGGSILPLEPLLQSTEQKPEGPLELRVYPGDNCQGDLYQDDGKTEQYKRGGFVRIHYACEVLPNGIRLTLGAHEGTFQPWWQNIEVAVYDWPDASARASLEGNAIARPQCDPEHRVLKIVVPDNGKAQQLELLRAGGTVISKP